MVFCHRCGKESEDEARYCRSCGARLAEPSRPVPETRARAQPCSTSKPSPDALTELKRLTGRAVEKTVEVTGKVVRAAKPAAKKGWEATKTAVKTTGEAVKKAGRKLQDKE